MPPRSTPAESRQACTVSRAVRTWVTTVSDSGPTPPPPQRPVITAGPQEEAGGARGTHVAADATGTQQPADDVLR
ncbi:hypothetical protein [Streptomyces melanogenes]|uniref:hypothetical protein n=1 Tax=Streptomyces melanogenes TaxID=67326 RepID=UPI003797D159